jgi:hypothetical protein
MVNHFLQKNINLFFLFAYIMQGISGILVSKITNPSLFFLYFELTLESQKFCVKKQKKDI